MITNLRTDISVIFIRKETSQQCIHIKGNSNNNYEINVNLVAIVNIYSMTVKFECRYFHSKKESNNFISNINRMPIYEGNNFGWHVITSLLRAFSVYESSECVLVLVVKEQYGHVPVFPRHPQVARATTV